MKETRKYTQEEIWDASYKLISLMYDIKSAAYGKGYADAKICYDINTESEKKVSENLNFSKERDIKKFKQILSDLIQHI